MTAAQKRRDQRRRFHQRRARRAMKRRRRKKKFKSSTKGARVAKRYLPRKHHAISCPASLHIDRDTHSTVQALQFFSELYQAITKGEFDRITIDHQELQDASPAAVLVLLAYTHHAMQKQPLVRLKAILPTNPSALSILQSVGYFDYYQLKATIPPDTHSGIFGHLREQGVKTRHVAQFMEKIPVGLVSTSSLYEALIEASQNTDEWAYKREEQHRHWWLMAAHPPKSGEISICFVDLGAGIPETIRSRLKDRIPFVSPRGCDLIHKAVMEGHYSRTRKSNRGRGLPTLRRLIDSVPHGQMTVLSRGSYFQYKRGSYQSESMQPTFAQELHKGSDLHGTVISWKISKP